MDTIEEEVVKRQHSEAGKNEAVESRPQNRRRSSKAYKRQMVEETLTGEDLVSVVAGRHDINTNMLFSWHKQYLAGRYDEGTSATSLTPITVTKPHP